MNGLCVDKKKKGQSGGLLQSYRMNCPDPIRQACSFSPICIRIRSTAPARRQLWATNHSRHQNLTVSRGILPDAQAVWDVRSKVGLAL